MVIQLDTNAEKVRTPGSRSFFVRCRHGIEFFIFLWGENVTCRKYFYLFVLRENKFWIVYYLSGRIRIRCFWRVGSDTLKINVNEVRLPNPQGDEAIILWEVPEIWGVTACVLQALIILDTDCWASAIKRLSIDHGTGHFSAQLNETFCSVRSSPSRWRTLNLSWRQNIKITIFVLWNSFWNVKNACWNDLIPKVHPGFIY